MTVQIIISASRCNDGIYFLFDKGLLSNISVNTRETNVIYKDESICAFL